MKLVLAALLFLAGAAWAQADMPSAAPLFVTRFTGRRQRVWVLRRVSRA